MIVADSRPTPCDHCGLSASLQTMNTHGGVRFAVDCLYCGNRTRGNNLSPTQALTEFREMTPHHHRIGMGYFLNEEEGAAYVFRSIDTKNHRSCMEIEPFGGYDEIMVKFDFCPDCGADVRPLIENLKNVFPSKERK